MFAAIAQWPHQRWPWFLLVSSALFLMLAALYFQFVLGFAPCSKCVYQRVAICGIFLAGLLGLAGHPYAVFRWPAYFGWGISAGFGLKIAHDQVSLEVLVRNGGFSSCEIFPNFPEWLALHQWLPELFNPTGICGEIDWQFLGQTMPYWMRIVFAIYLMVCFVIIASQLQKRKYNPYD